MQSIQFGVLQKFSNIAHLKLTVFALTRRMSACLAVHQEHQENCGYNGNRTACHYSPEESGNDLIFAVL